MSAAGGGGHHQPRVGAHGTDDRRTAYCGTVAEWQGTLWNISSVEVAYPRLILELGEPYHEDVERS